MIRSGGNMKLTGLKAAGLVLGILAVSVFLGAQAPERFFDTAPVEARGRAAGRLLSLRGDDPEPRGPEEDRGSWTSPGSSWSASIIPGKRPITPTASRLRPGERHRLVPLPRRSRRTSPRTPSSRRTPARRNTSGSSGPRTASSSSAVPTFRPPSSGKRRASSRPIEDPVRHYFEVSAIFHLLGGSQDPAFQGLLEGRPDFPVLGICLGCQSLNVGTGGDPRSRTSGTRSTGRRASRTSSPSIPSNGTTIRTSSSIPGTGSSATTSTGSGSRKRASSARTWASRAPTARGPQLPPPGPGKDGPGVADDRVVHGREDRRSRRARRGSPTSSASSSTPSTGLLWESDPVHRQAPGDTAFSYKALLEGTPPSYDFNQGIWRWLEPAARSRPPARGRKDICRLP